MIDGRTVLGAVSGWVWLGFWLLWLVWGTVTNRQRPVVAQDGRRLGLIWWAGLIAVLFLSSGGYFHRLLSSALWPGSLPAMETGFLLEVLGMALAVWARYHLGSFWSSRAVVRQGHRVVDTGPYRLIRHPIYSGILLALIGTFLMAGGIALLAIVAGYMIYVVFKALGEERLLTRELGDEYRRYRSHTHMLIPWLL